jgi:pilus assembly protein Flp/PilA
MIGKLIKFFKEEEGTAAVEYGILLALIAAALISAIATVGSRISRAF